MVSYSWHDSEAAELLHEELALRGVVVAHDRCTFPTGYRVSAAMREAAASCDGYVGYFTSASLYEDRPDGMRPVIDDEFLPVMDRLTAPHPPVIVPVTHGLGDPRIEACDRIRNATGRDVSSLWMPVILDQETTGIAQAEAAAVARVVAAAVLARDVEKMEGAPLGISIVTRGSGQAAGPLSVDATRALGGLEPRPGSEADWDRFAVGLRDLEASLASTMHGRDVRVRARTHMTGAVAFGRTFHQAAGWRLTVDGRHGDVSYSSAVAPQDLYVGTDVGTRGGDVSVEIDLLDLGVSMLAAERLAALPSATPSRLVARREPTCDLRPEGAAGAARVVSDGMRELVHDRRPGLTHLFFAGPVEVGVLLGHRLTSLHTDVQLYERDREHYVPTLRLAC